jgi:hypothetical protein
MSAFPPSTSPRPFGLETSKYGARKTVVDGITFASAAEARRYGELRLLEKAKLIRNIELQPQFPFTIDGKIIFKYIADFAYFEGQTRKIEDVKGFKTPLYKLKKKLIEAQFDVKITEIS